MVRFARFTWALLAYEIAVVAWGGFVRATGSGAGCGAHWPLCNGEIVPRSPHAEMRIEFSHRLSSGVALLLAAFLFLWARRAFPRGDRIRRGAAATAGFMVGEALIGAGLVLFGLVAHDESLRRAVSICLHLTNTFLLLASTALTAWWASGHTIPLRLRGQGPVAWVMGLTLAGLLVVGATGALTALGDTLFPPTSLAAGLAQDLAYAAAPFGRAADLAPGANALVRLRTLHPLLAAAAGTGVVVAGALARVLRPSHAVRRLSRMAAALVIVQVAAGLIDVTLLAPVWMQLVHLALADAVWVSVVLTAAATLDARLAPQAAAERLDDATGLAGDGTRKTRLQSG
jgi:heme A synthase